MAEVRRHPNPMVEGSYYSQDLGPHSGWVVVGTRQGIHYTECLLLLPPFSLPLMQAQTPCMSD